MKDWLKKFFFASLFLLGLINLVVLPLINATGYFIHYARAETTEGVIVDYKYKRLRSSGRSRGVKKRHAPVFTYTPKGTNKVIRIEDKFGHKQNHFVGDKVIVYYIPSDHNKARRK